MEEDGLVAQGWIIYAGIGIMTVQSPGGNLYEYTKAAKEYCEHVWKKVAINEKQNGSIMLQAIDEEDIDKLPEN